MSARLLTVLLVLATGCGSARDLESGSTPSTNVGVTTEVTQATAPTSTITTITAPSTDAAQVSTTPGAVYQQVQLEATIPALDGPATLWHVPAMAPDPGRLARWARAFGFTEEEIGAAIGSRTMRNTPDGQVLSISEPTGHWVFVDGPAGMYATPGSCPLPAVAPPSTITGATPPILPPGQRCADRPPSGIPDPRAAEDRARSLWETLGIDLLGVRVTVGGDEYLREVIASDDLGGVVVARLRVVIGVDGRLMRATGSLDAPIAAGSVPRLGLVEALNRFARQPPSAGPGTTAPASFDGVYRVTGATGGLTTYGEQWLVPSYVIALADGRTITLLAIDPADIPAG